MGSTVSTWICYTWSVITSKDKTGFGKGDVRGVIGCEAANNASAGGAMIPTIAFGVPGSTITALVLVVFWAVDINPGPKLLTEHLDMVYLIIWSIALANIIGAAVCYLLTNKLALLTKVPAHILAPLVMAVIVAGTLYATASVGGVVVLIAFGILGWFMKSLGWPRPAFLLAFILGPIIEKFYFHSVMMYGGAMDHASRGDHHPPFSCRRYLSGIDHTKESRECGGKISMKNIVSYTFTSLWIIALAMALYVSRNWNSTTALFPQSVGIPMLVLVGGHPGAGYPKSAAPERKGGSG